MSQLLNLFTWVGGKTKLAKEIISIMPDHYHYVETNFASGVVFFNKRKAPANTINDIDDNLMNIYRQIILNEKEFTNRVYWTLFSRSEHKRWMYALQNNFKDISDVDRAIAYLYLILTSYQNMVGGGFTPSIKRNTADQFNHDLIPKIKLIREALDSVVIETSSMMDLIPKYDTPDCLIYSDPPYYSTSETDIYVHNFTKTDHTTLFLKLMRCKANWMLSYDSAPEIIEMYKNYEQIRLKTNYNQQGREKKVEELLIINFKHKHPQMNLYDKPEVTATVITDEEKQQNEFVVSIKREQEEEQAHLNDPNGLKAIQQLKDEGKWLEPEQGGLF
jgi:DNA adenine methylase